MKVAFVGSRDYPEDLMWRIDAVIDSLPKDAVVVSGAARGVDSRAANAARERGLEVIEYPADWSKGKGAGFARNRDIIAGAAHVYAFQHQNSRGTAHSIQLAIEAGIPVTVYPSDGYPYQIVRQITTFRGEYGFLSNFHSCRVVVGGYECHSAEQAYQLCKAADEAGRAFIMDARTPLEAKRRGRQIAMRPGFEAVKVMVMRRVVEAKFRQNPDLWEQLVNTGDAALVEGHTSDTFWGRHQGKGENMLGRILEGVRRSLLESDDESPVMDGSILWVTADENEMFRIPGVWTVPANLRCDLNRTPLGARVAKRFPALVEDYIDSCIDFRLDVGQPYLFDDPSGQRIMVFATKRSPDHKAEIGFIRDGIGYARSSLTWDDRALVLPMLGRGELAWDAVQAVYAAALHDMPTTVYALEPVEKDVQEETEGGREAVEPRHKQLSLQFVTR